MSEYLHGAYGQIKESGSRASSKSRSAFVYVGTAPVHNVAGGGQYVNKPVMVDSIAEAMRCFGYSDEWDKYTLCEAMHVHLQKYGVGPLILINVLDPQVHKAAEGGSKTITPEKGRLVIADAQDIILDSVAVSGKKLGEDYALAYDRNKRVLIISEYKKGGLGTEALTVTYDLIDPEAVEADDVMGLSDGMGLNTGLYAVKNVYQLTGYIPSFLAAPGFSGEKEINEAMCEVARNINGHFWAWTLADLPLTDDEGAGITLDSAAAYKKQAGYTQENGKVFFPMGDGADSKKYHLSVLAAASLNRLLIENDGIPYMTDSNTECSLIKNIYLGADGEGRLFDDQLINEKLNKNGIASAAYVGGRFVLWGAHCADYDQDNAGEVNVADTNRMMLYYLINDFQHRRARDVDKPKTANDIASIVAEEQARLDALVKTGALIYGEVFINAERMGRSDLFSGDYMFSFRVTTTPLAKSLTADVAWVSDGYSAYFGE
mgnify:CR=1 FL=1